MPSNRKVYQKSRHVKEKIALTKVFFLAALRHITVHFTTHILFGLMPKSYFGTDALIFKANVVPIGKSIITSFANILSTFAFYFGFIQFRRACFPVQGLIWARPLFFVHIAEQGTALLESNRSGSARLTAVAGGLLSQVSRTP